MSDPSSPRRPLGGEDLIAGVESLALRLDRNLAHWDSGAKDAMHDVAGIVRTLLAFGKGDKAIKRLCSQEHIGLPQLVVPSSIEAAPGTISSFGGFVADDRLSGPAPRMSLIDWLQSSFFRSSEPGVIGHITWEQLIVQWGNTYGAHLSVTRSEYLDQLEVIDAAGFVPLSEYALRSAALAAQQSAQQALSALGRAVPTPRRFASPIATLWSCSHRLHPEFGVYEAMWEVGFGYTPGVFPIARANFHGMVIETRARISIEPDGTLSQALDNVWINSGQ